MAVRTECLVSGCGWSFDGRDGDNQLALHMAATHPLYRKSREEIFDAIRTLQRDQPHLSGRQQAAVLGISYSAMRNVLNDPDGSKQATRRERYVGECVDCGRETRSDGTSRSSPRCPECAAIDARTWTVESIIGAISEFAERYGHAPTVVDFSPAHARQVAGKVSAAKRQRYLDAAERFEHDRCWPAAATVVERFGSFAAGIAAAGEAANPRQPRWNRDLIVERVKAWVEIHGRPPTTSDWNAAESEWPSDSTCYYHFGSFGAAIRAAGFEPIGKGFRRTMRVYYVLHKNGDKAFHVVEVEAFSPEQAIEKVADSEGEWIAVQERYWVKTTVKEQTKLAVVKA